MLFMLMGLIVLVIGLGAIGTNKTRLQNAANSAALAALEGYVNADPSLLTFSDKANAAILRANAILSKNSMPGAGRDLGELGLFPAGGAGGLVEFGMWFTKAPDPLNPTNHCSGDYPCFETYNPPNVADVNSARVLVHNQADNPLIVSIAGIIGRSNFFLSANSTAALAPRCVAYLMDVSGSAQYETHPGANSVVNRCNPAVGGCGDAMCDATCRPFLCDQCYPNGDPFKFYPPDPENVGLGFLRQSEVQPGGTDINCSNIGVFGSSDAHAWCNYFRDPRPGAPVLPFRHNRHDYDVETAKIDGVLQPILVDKLFVPGVYEGPQPLTRNFLAFNTGLRYVESTSSPGDLSVVMAFTSNIRDRYPDPAIAGQGELTKDMGFLIQLTNLENRGMKKWDGDTAGLAPEIHPNFIDRGWFPVPVLDGDATNLVKALHVAANALHSECLPTSRKAIVLATDGVSTCSVTNDPNPQPVCATSYANYLTAENQLLNTDIYTGTPRIPNIRQLLASWEISLTSLVDSIGVRPNFYSVRTNASGCIYPVGTGPQPTDPKCFLTYEQARAIGYGGAGDPLSFFDYSSYVPPGLGPNTEDNAYANFGQSGVVFGRPIGVLGKMAIETGGFMCGLLPTASVGFYEDFAGDRNGAACDAPCDSVNYKCSPCTLKGNSGYRAPTCDPEHGIPCTLANAQVWAPEYLPKSEQAARCVRNTVGLNPFTLVARDLDQ